MNWTSYQQCLGNPVVFRPNLIAWAFVGNHKTINDFMVGFIQVCSSIQPIYTDDSCKYHPKKENHEDYMETKWFIKNTNDRFQMCQWDQVTCTPIVHTFHWSRWLSRPTAPLQCGWDHHEHRDGWNHSWAPQNFFSALLRIRCSWWLMRQPWMGDSHHSISIQVWGDLSHDDPSNEYMDIWSLMS